MLVGSGSNLLLTDTLFSNNPVGGGTDLSCTSELNAKKKNNEGRKKKGCLMNVGEYYGFTHFIKVMSQQQQPPSANPQGVLQQSSQQQQPQLNQQQDFDPVHRFKMLIPQLKESLQVCLLCKDRLNLLRD